MSRQHPDSLWGTLALIALPMPLALISSWILDRLDNLLLLLFFTTDRGASKHASLMQLMSEGVANAPNIHQVKLPIKHHFLLLLILECATPLIFIRTGGFASAAFPRLPDFPFPTLCASDKPIINAGRDIHDVHTNASQTRCSHSKQVGSCP
jgi:hypothetical protein